MGGERDVCVCGKGKKEKGNFSRGQNRDWLDFRIFGLTSPFSST